MSTNTKITTHINNKVERFNNQYFYNEKVGVYLIKLKEKVVLFDLPTYSDDTALYLTSFHKPILAILSHGSCGIKDGIFWQNKHNVKVYLHEPDKNSSWLFMQPDVLYKETSFLDESLEIITTPGHSPGSICLLEKTTQSLFTGDTCSGNTNGEIRDFLLQSSHDDMEQRFKSCKKLLEYDFVNILPFHYEMILVNAKVALEKFVANQKRYSGTLS